MIVTEEQARLMWCPEVRVPSYHYRADEGDGPASSNRFMPSDDKLSTQPAVLRCIASGCMAWRWSDDPANEPDAERADEASERIRAGYAVGYCGKAGKP